MGVALVLLSLAPPSIAKEVPYLGGRVNDLAGMLGAETETRLEQSLKELEQRTGAQLVVLTVESLEGEVLEDYSLRVAETWGLGRAEQDDGVLLLIAKNDRQMRIEVGYGLEDRLTDLQSGRILKEVIRPRFREGEFEHGIEQGVAAIVAAVEGGAIDAYAAPQSASGGNLTGAPLLARAAFFLIFFVVVGTFALLALFSSGCSSWFLYLFLTPFFATFPSVSIHPLAGPIAAGAWLIGFPLFKLWLAKTGSGRRFLEEHPGWKGFAGAGGSGGGWSSGGGGFSGGGFSGGGGSFGGGGASSGW
jgi:uncharacterized protein